MANHAAQLRLAFVGCRRRAASFAPEMADFEAVVLDGKTPEAPAEAIPR